MTNLKLWLINYEYLTKQALYHAMSIQQRKVNVAYRVLYIQWIAG